MSNSDFIKRVWESIYDPNVDVAETVKHYFHEDYKQCINGIPMNREEYIQHVIEQKKNIIIDHIDYKHVIERENELFALYYPKGKNLDGQTIEAEVIVYFRFENAQIVRIHGQVQIITGNLTDVDMDDT